LKGTIVLLLLLFNSIFSQEFEHNTAFLPQGLSLPLLNGYGNSAIHNDVSNISAINPAALGNFEKVEFGFSYQYESEIKEAWITEIGSKRINNMVPQSVGLVLPFNNLNFAISMNQRYNSTLFTNINVANPCEAYLNENRQFYDYVLETIIYNYAFSTSYQFENLLPNSEFSVGFRVGLNNLAEQLHIENISYNASIYENDFSFRMLYSTNLTNNRNLSLGLYYQSPLEISGSAKFEYKPLPYCGTDAYMLHDATAEEVNLVAKFPSSLRFDLYFSQIEQFQFLFSISNSDWSKLDLYIRDQVEFSSSVSYFINKSLSFSVGFAKSEKEYVTNFMDINRNLEVVYFTAGSVFTIDDLSVNFSYADSHLSAGDFRKQQLEK